MATSKKSLHEGIRKTYMEIVKNALTANGDEVLVVGTNEFALPCVDAEGNDEFLVLTFKVPTGSRDGEAYDGYSVRDDFIRKQEEKAEKAKITAEKKAKKIAKDKAMREAKAKAKAEREQAKEE